MRKKVLFLVIFIIIAIISVFGYRYIKYHDFFGKFYGEQGGYIQFDFWSWKINHDNSNELKCSLWNCNIESGNIYYTKGSSIHMRFDSKAEWIEKFKLEEKNGKIYLYFYNSNDEISDCYVKEHHKK